MKCANCGFPEIGGQCPCTIGVSGMLSVFPGSREKKLTVYAALLIVARNGGSVMFVHQLQDDSLEVGRNFASEDEPVDGIAERLYRWHEIIVGMLSEGMLISVEELFVDRREFPYWSSYRMRLIVLGDADGNPPEERVFYSGAVLKSFHSVTEGGGA